MTDPRLDDPKPLEPWMLEQLREEGSADDPQTRQELARLVALLRSLPEPEPAPDLAARALAYVAQQQSRPRAARILRSRPATAFLIAAGVAALFAITFSPETIPSVLRQTEESPIRDVRRRAPVVRPQYVTAALGTQGSGPRVMRSYSWPAEDMSMRLDHQLNQLMINPTAFAQRLEQIAPRDEFIARLTERAAERGDASEIALHVRESPHPLAGVLMERMLHATLVTDVRPR